MMFRSSIVSTILVPSVSMQIAVDDRGSFTHLESGKPGGTDKGPPCTGNPTKWRGFQQVSGVCTGGEVVEIKPKFGGKFKSGKKAKPQFMQGLGLKLCKIKCHADEKCQAFQYGEVGCQHFESVEISADNEDECTAATCCYAKQTEFHSDGTGGEVVTVADAPDDDEGDDEPEADPESAAGLLLNQQSGFVALNMSADQDEFLSVHNKYRCMHGAGPLTWNNQMAQNAAGHGASCCQSGLKHSNSYGMSPSSGENLAAGYGSITAAVKGWYDEVQDCGPFPGCTDGKTGVVGHFTAMVWKDSKELGCAVNPTGWNGRPLYVCHYADTPPNFGGRYTTNVFAQTKQESQCAQGGGPAPSPPMPPPAPPTPPNPPPPSMPPPAPPPASEYTLSEKGANSCNGGDPISSATACEAAAPDVGKRFAGEKNNKKWPTGCVRKKNGIVYFNKHAANAGHANFQLVCGAAGGPPPAPEPEPTAEPTPEPTPEPEPDPTPAPAPPPAGCPGDRNPTTITMNGARATCSQLGRFCSGYSFVRDQCPCTCNIPPTPAPPPGTPGSLGACCTCSTHADCAGGFCCPGMKKCGSGPCSGSPDCTVWRR